MTSVHVTVRVEGLVHELRPVGLHAAFGQRWGEIHDRVFQGLHLDQEAFESFQGNATRIGSQFDQGFGVRGVSKLTHAHFDGKFLELAPSFDHGAHGRQTRHQGVVVPNGAHDHPGGHQQERHPVEQSVVKLVLVQYFSMTPPLFVVKGKQGIHALQEFRFELGTVRVGPVHQRDLHGVFGRHFSFFFSEGIPRRIALHAGASTLFIAGHDAVGRGDVGNASSRGNLFLVLEQHAQASLQIGLIERSLRGPSRRGPGWSPREGRRRVGAWRTSSSAASTSASTWLFLILPGSSSRGTGSHRHGRRSTSPGGRRADSSRGRRAASTVGGP